MIRVIENFNPTEWDDPESDNGSAEDELYPEDEEDISLEESDLEESV